MILQYGFIPIKPGSASIAIPHPGDLHEKRWRSCEIYYPLASEICKRSRIHKIEQAFCSNRPAPALPVAID